MPLPGVTGKSGELVVVMDEDLWKGEAGDTVFSGLTQHVYGLPQAEPTFNVVHIKSSAFTKIFQTHRNIFLAHIGPEYKALVELKTDVWASPQIVIEIAAPTVEEFTKLFGQSLGKVISHIIEKEESRTLHSYKAQLNNDVIAHLKSDRFLNLTIPKGYNLARTEDDFSWVRYETKDVTQSILIYTEPYSRQNTFTKEGMIEVMNIFSKKYVPGPDPDTYMTTYLEYPPLFEETVLADEYASSLKGLWNIEGALMGGPFVTYALLDKPRNRVIYLHGFVFAPGKNKRNYLRQVESIINSLELM